MDNLQKYKPTDKMIDLISDNYSLLQVMSRFGLSLGFGDKTVKEVCELNGVDCRTFLIVVNFMSEGFSRMDGSSEDISIPALIDYLRQAHIYFLDFSLPAIRRKLIEAIDCSQDDVAFLILKFFDEYTREVRKHMDYEEKTVFKYVDALINGIVNMNMIDGEESMESRNKLNFYPKISIITVTLNSERTLEETIKSILSQDYPNIEYLVIDGGSIDGTLEIIDKYASQISYTISEKDKGISDAFNKGIKRATGEIVGIINSDDLLLPGALFKLAECYDKNVDVYRGNVVVYDENSDSKWRDIPSMKFPLVSFNIRVAHPGTFIRKDAYELYGAYRIDLKYQMDKDLLIRFYDKGASFLYIDYDIALFRIGGATSDSLKKKKTEIMEVIRLNGGGKFQAYLVYCIALFRAVLKKTRYLIGGK